MTVIALSRHKHLKPDEVQVLVDTVLKGGEQSHKARDSGFQEQDESENKELKATNSKFLFKRTILVK